MFRRFLDWSTLTYSPSLMTLARFGDPAGRRYAEAWMARRERAKRLPLLGAFFRAWEAA